MLKYNCPCCSVPLQLVETRPRGDTCEPDTMSIDLHFECMTCAHILSMIVNVPEIQFIPSDQWYDHLNPEPGD